MRLLAISGSLRAHSSNGELLRALARMGGSEIDVEIYDGLATLPHFNPDLDQDGMVLPEPVQELRRKIADADGLLISSPEYAHGVPGSLKNALDWLVSGPEMVYKPIGLLNPSPRSIHAQASIAETLRTMSTTLVDGACIALPISGRGLDADGILANEELRARLDGVLEAMRTASLLPPLV
jgi:chromate reductase, NAD(P)H dehydrogenase (quinone)